MGSQGGRRGVPEFTGEGDGGENCQPAVRSGTDSVRVICILDRTSTWFKPSTRTHVSNNIMHLNYKLRICTWRKSH